MKKLISIIYLVVVLLLIWAVLLYLRNFVLNTLNDDPVTTVQKQSKENNKPQRIVSLAPNITEILYELGLGDKVIAVSNDCDYPPEAESKQKVGSFWQPSVETVIACKPDLVITLWFTQQNSVARTLERLDYKVLTLKLESLDELRTAIEKIGKAAGRIEKAKELNKKIQTQLSQIQEQNKSKDRPKVLWVVQPDPLRVAGTKTFITELLNLAGADNAIPNVDIQYPSISKEQMLSCQADIIIQAAMTKHNINKQQKQAEEFWSKYPYLPAVKNNRIYVINPDMILRLGPRTPQGLMQVSDIIHKSDSETGL